MKRVSEKFERCLAEKQKRYEKHRVRVSEKESFRQKAHEKTVDIDAKRWMIPTHSYK